MADKDDLNDDNMPDDDKDLQDLEDLKDPPAYVAPSKDEWDRTTAALKKANNQARKLRQDKRAALAHPSDNTSAGATGSAAENAAAVAAARAEGTSASDAKWKPKVIANAAKAALVAAGLTGSPDRMIRMLDHEDLDVGDDGAVDGLDEQIAELKTEYPDLFKTVKTTKTKTSVNGGRQSVSEGGKKKSSAELIAERFGANA